MKTNILEGIRVLDFTRVLAGPYTTRILGDYGAEVIKVQSSKTPANTSANSQAYFNTWNRNKKSITLNMSCPEAHELAVKLIKISDIVVENFSPRVMANWQLAYENIKEIKKNIIMLSMSGMGQTGPWKNYTAFGPTVQSLGGLTHLTSYGEKEAPSGSGFAYADIISGLYGAVGILAALEYRDKTGMGQYIDLSEYEAVCTMIAPELMDAHINRTIHPSGNSAGNTIAAPHGCYQCFGTDRWCVIAVFEDIQWHALCRVMGQPALALKESFSTLSKRKAHAEQLDELINAWTLKQSVKKAVNKLQKAGVPSGLVQNAQDLAHDDHLLKRGFFKKLPHPQFKETITDTSPVKFKEMGDINWECAPFPGQDNPYVYMDLLGLSKNRYSDYVEKGIIG